MQGSFFFQISELKQTADFPDAVEIYLVKSTELPGKKFQMQV